MILEGRIWHPQNGLTEGCVAVGDDGNIDPVAKTMACPTERVRTMLLPAGFDMHVHFRDPGFPQKETWASGSAAAACGGGGMLGMPNSMRTNLMPVSASSRLASRFTSRMASRPLSKPVCASIASSVCRGIGMLSMAHAGSPPRLITVAPPIYL